MLVKLKKMNEIETNLKRDLTIGHYPYSLILLYIRNTVCVLLLNVYKVINLSSRRINYCFDCRCEGSKQPYTTALISAAVQEFQTNKEAMLVFLFPNTKAAQF